MPQKDTLDLIHHAEIGLKYLTSMVDQKRNYEPYWYVHLNEDPPRAQHMKWDTTELPGSWVHSIILSRKMTGSREGVEVEQALKMLLLSGFREDGLRVGPPTPWFPGDSISIHEQAYILEGLVTWFIETGKSDVQNAVDCLVNGLIDYSFGKGALYGKRCSC